MAASCFMTPGGNRSLMAAAVHAAGATLVVSKQMSLFNTSSYVPTSYDVARDGRFLNVRIGEANSQQKIVVVQNWIEELKARVAAK